MNQIYLLFQSYIYVFSHIQIRIAILQHEAIEIFAIKQI
jgi:hypothetical protein